MKRQCNCDTEEDLWFLPATPEDVAPTDMPWPIAAREASIEPKVWQAAEKEQYRGLLGAVQAATKFGERLRQFPNEVAERFAIETVSAILRSEGTWISPEQIALYRTLRIASDDAAQDLSRADWAVRRLKAGRSLDVEAGGALDGLHDFLGRTSVVSPQSVPGEERPVGEELSALSDRWSFGLDALSGCHPLTKAAYGFASWRAEGITPYEELLEPTTAALLVGVGGLAPFLPMGQGHRLDRHSLRAGSAGAEERLVVFYGAIEAGALAAALELDRLRAWQERAGQAVSDLSGRTPPKMVAALMRAPVVSADWLAQEVGCTTVSVRRNLKTFTERGLVREVTGQDRYRFWTVTP
ncbi:helix-turn-helix domain-containing protein [Aliiroseovarius subalbicans]|uniref:helix-turn-helix domain-containing protein n=1 Tax=Aliiroseovarius subalbicans TaxID=2925840 RepID=UPI001F596925|nr:helix-turn-helix domain-containing protein [Aliiroseovarius subalbicans]MCI2400953.1 hypothetical protein [Aliiroseovarius subalbicans]